MDAGRFDALTRALSADGTRRGIVRLLAAIPLAGELGAYLGEASEAGRRRRRRKVRHRPGKEKDQRKGKRKKQKKCKPDPLTQTCAGKCGVVQNNCRQPVDCSSCACTPPCSECEECNEESGRCVPNPATVAERCGQPGQVCQADGRCVCDDDSCGTCGDCAADGFCTTPCGGNGCCDAEQGCQLGTDADACGIGGDPCQVCGGDRPTCGIAEPGVCGCIPFVCPATACGTTPDGCGDTVNCGGCDNFLRPICVNNACAPCSAENPCLSEARCCEGACLTAEMCCEDEDCAPGGDACSDFACRCGLSNACSGDTPDCCGEAGECTNVLSDPANCGACGAACEAYEACKNGTCACDVCSDGSCDFSSVQDAISEARPGNTIHICPGRYQETLTIHQNLNLIGAGAGATLNDTVIDGAGSTGVVMLIQEGVTASLIGLHITGGQAIGQPGGITNQGASLTMTDCSVVGNSASVSAGGMANQTGTLTMTNCTIEGNSAPQQGGGLVNLGGTVTLITTRVIMNQQTAPGDEMKTQKGGGIFNTAGTVKLQNASFVTDNTANGGLGAGGGIYNLGVVSIDSTSAVEANSPDNCIDGPGGTGCSG
jgi:hypothetical protein